MIVDEEVVTHIAELAHLEILPAEMQEYVESLRDVLNLVEQMQNIDTGGIETLAHPFDGVQRLRADVVRESNQREYFQDIAPETAEGLYLVPKVIE